jgi:hypothetical protein
MPSLGARSGWRATVSGILLGAALLSSIALLSAASPARAARPLTRAFTDDLWFDAVGPSWIPRTVATGARVALLEIDWAGVEPNAPRPGFDPSSPSAPQYNFGYVDAIVREFAGTGISPAFLVTDAPQWAEAPGGPAELEADGAWEPNATAFGQLAAALAHRYSGSYPDPLNPGQKLPRVRYYQAWAEANLAIHLAPQWTSSGGKLVAASPTIYRNMLNAFYAGIKSAHANNVVITTGTAPYGSAPPPASDPLGGERMYPVDFVRGLLCLQGRALAPAACPQPAHFDALAHDPYEVGSPTTRAYFAGDVSAPDLGKLTRIVNKAVRLGRALPRTHKQLWITEFSYDSNPPNPTGVSLATQARWLEESFYIFWKQGVSAAVWYLLRDQTGDVSTHYFSGVYYYNGRPKPSLQAYRFPFVVMPSGRGTTAWGISPRRGLVAIERRRGHKWKTLAQVHASAGGVFVHPLPAGLRGSFRALVDGQSSLVWKVR